MAAEFGSLMHTAGIVLHGRLEPERWVELLRAITAAVGMEPVGEPAQWVYPVDGKGGQGRTIVLPITESFLALDSWDEHEGAYLFVCSCRGYATADIDKTAQSFGLRVELREDRRFYRELRLK